MKSNVYNLGNLFNLAYNIPHSSDYSSINYHSHHSSIYASEYENTQDRNSEQPEFSPEEREHHIRMSIQKHILLTIFVLFLMAFVVAAGVEETMKHFVVRCCRFPTPLKDPHSILVYLMAGALGFATSENIEYVFGTTTSPIPGTTVFIGELIVLLTRVLMPIHVICSVIQAANLSKVCTLIIYDNV
jgi:hypothetical protein